MPDDAIAGVEIFDGSTDLGPATSNGNGTWSFTAGGLAEGAHDFSAVVRDAAGNSATSALAAVEVATHAPTTSASELISGLTDQNYDTITVKASAEAVTGDAIASVEIYDRGNAVGAATLSNGLWSYTASNCGRLRP